MEFEQTHCGNICSGQESNLGLGMLKAITNLNKPCLKQKHIIYLASYLVSLTPLYLIYLILNLQ